MSLKFTWWFGIFAFCIGVMTLLGRIFKFKRLFNRIDNDDYWEPFHVFRYTVMPFLISAFAAFFHFQ